MDLENFLPLLRDALYHVPQSYYRHELWRNEDWHHVIEEITDPTKLLELREFLDRYGERVFCYELYHQVRISMEQYYRNNDDPEQYDVLFQAELKKDQLQSVREYYSEAVSPLNKAYFPDFLLHAPGNFQHQELIIEVKSNPAITMADINDDLIKIHEFIDRYQYRMGLFLTVNSDPQRISHLLEGIREKNQIDEIFPHRADIQIWCKPSQNVQFQGWCLGDL